METEAILGTWELVSWTVERAGNPVAYPMGEDGQGRVHYGADGHMFVLIWRKARPTLGWPLPAPEETREDIVRAYASVIVYCGSYELADDEVRHHVVFSNNPALIGQVLPRPFSFEHEHLVLHHVAPDGSPGKLVWKRPEPGQVL